MNRKRELVCTYHQSDNWKRETKTRTDENESKINMDHDNASTICFLYFKTLMKADVSTIGDVGVSRNCVKC